MRLRTVAGVILVVCSWTSLSAWGGQGHRLVGLIAANHLSRTSAQNVAWLLDGQSLAGISSWADGQVSDWQQTAQWHYLNIPPGATGYDRDRDCPRQPGVAAGARADQWRDCAVDRITYMEQRVADGKLGVVLSGVEGPQLLTPNTRTVTSLPPRPTPSA